MDLLGFLRFRQMIRDFQAIILSFVVDFRESQKEACL